MSLTIQNREKEPRFSSKRLFILVSTGLLSTHENCRILFGTLWNTLYIEMEKYRINGAILNIKSIVLKSKMHANGILYSI